ncbi:hypothetical protein INR49_006371, partial [Caranx melampygus]
MEGRTAATWRTTAFKRRLEKTGGHGRRHLARDGPRAESVCHSTHGSSPPAPLLILAPSTISTTWGNPTDSYRQKTVFSVEDVSCTDAADGLHASAQNLSFTSSRSPPPGFLNLFVQDGEIMSPH